MRVRACAKINLALEVGRRRADGYHQLVTLFQSIELADELWFEPAETLVLEVEGAAPAGPDNLVLRAARSLQQSAGVGAGAAIRLKKRIPMGGGLGGGSSDAAATLLALDRLWQTRASREELFRLALALGSDVPFFLLGGTALGLGRGEQLVPIAALPPREVVLLLPDLQVSTAEAFGRLREEGARPAPGSSSRWHWPLLWDWAPGALGDLGNDFEPSVFRLHPGLVALKQLLVDAGAEHALLSGSGAALYGLFPDPGAADVAARTVAAATSVSVVRTRTVGPAALADAGRG